MRYYEFIAENKTTLNKLYSGNFPDRDETFWDYVRTGELDVPLQIKTLPKYKLTILLQGQYRVEHLDEILDMMDEDQRAVLDRYMNDPKLSNLIIVLSDNRIIDGNHRALAAAMKGVPINYVDLADLDEQDVAEAVNSAVFKQGFEKSKPILDGKYTLIAKNGRILYHQKSFEPSDQFRIEVKTNKGALVGWVNFENIDDNLEALDLYVDIKHRRKGIATEIYKFARELGNTIKPSNKQTALGKSMWQGFNKKEQGVAEGKQQVERNGIQLDVSIDGATVDIRPMINGNQVGYVVFDRDGKTLVADDLAIDEKYRGRGIAKIIYDYVKELGFTVKRSTDQLAAGKAFWDKYKGVQGQVWEDEHVDEMALQTYKTMGDFTKPGPFTGADKKLVPHPKNIEKATRFFEKTPFDFRLFFSHLRGTGKYSEHGPMSHDQLRQVFGQEAEEIINGSEDAITVVYVGNKGDAKVMLTPWMMAHRFGHAINAGVRNKNWTAWGEAEKYFFQTVNEFLEEHYGKVPATKPAGRNILYQLEPEYNALFNAMGTQRSSKSGQIRRPYEFLYELFAQYLGTGKVTLNALPTNLTYGRQVFGNPTKYMNIKPEYRDEDERKQAADSLAYTMELLFNDVLGDSVGQIYVM